MKRTTHAKLVQVEPLQLLISSLSSMWLWRSAACREPSAYWNALQHPVRRSALLKRQLCQSDPWLFRPDQGSVTVQPTTT